LDPQDFAEPNNCVGSLGAGKTCVITVTLTPTTTGARSAWVGINGNGGGSPQRVALSGTGTEQGSGVGGRGSEVRDQVPSRGTPRRAPEFPHFAAWPKCPLKKSLTG
jgi:hypothetical protein